MSGEIKPWFVTEPGGPMGRWPGVMEQGGRIIAFAVPDVATGMELIGLRAQLAAATAERDALALELAHLRPEWQAMQRERDAATARADAAEAALAAMPVEALRRTLLTGYRTDAQITADEDAINAWFGGETAASEQDAGLIVDSIGGMCPTQSEGTIGGNPFYFRARHGEWDLRVVKPGCDPVWPTNKEDLLLNWSGDDPSNGWMAEPDVMTILRRAAELLAATRA